MGTREKNKEDNVILSKFCHISFLLYLFPLSFLLVLKNALFLLCASSYTKSLRFLK